VLSGAAALHAIGGRAHIVEIGGGRGQAGKRDKVILTR
jgi:hypothetical protein